MIRFLTLSEIKRETGIPLSTLKGWIYQGRLEARQTPHAPGRGFSYLVRTDRLEPLVEEWRTTSRPGRLTIVNTLPKGRWLKPQDIAHSLAVTTATVHRWIRTGELGAIAWGSNRHKRVNAKELARFIKERTFKAA